MSRVNRMNVSYILVPLLASMLVSCKDDSPQTLNVPVPKSEAVVAGSPQEEARKTVTRYNSLLEQGYRNLNMTPLQEVATMDVAMKAYYHMAAIGEGKARMISRQKRIEFLKIETPSPGFCEVQTREVWDFAYAD